MKKFIKIYLLVRLTDTVPELLLLGAFAFGLLMLPFFFTVLFSLFLIVGRAVALLFTAFFSSFSDFMVSLAAVFAAFIES